METLEERRLRMVSLANQIDNSARRIYNQMCQYNDEDKVIELLTAYLTTLLQFEQEFSTFKETTCS